MINGQCVEKGLEYECHIIGHVNDYYIGDDLKLKEVLINILGNAVKFTPAPGSVTLSVEQTRQFEGYCTLRFVMKDTGIGMSKEFIPKIFDASPRRMPARPTSTAAPAWAWPSRKTS